jgi:hypothetical protein
MVASILALAGTCLLFFGYDAAVMSLVNINPDYLQHMNSANGTEKDAARVGGIVSFWFLGFFIGTNVPLRRPEKQGYCTNTPFVHQELLWLEAMPTKSDVSSRYNSVASGALSALVS